MSDLGHVPMEILRDIFQLVEPADIESLLLTCRSFRRIIVEHREPLPMRFLCDIGYCVYRDQIQLYKVGEPRQADTWGRGRPRECILVMEGTSGDPIEKQLVEVNAAMGRKVSIRRVDIDGSPGDAVNDPLRAILTGFPSATSAKELHVGEVAEFPSEEVLDMLPRLETFKLDTFFCEQNWEDVYNSFWREIFDNYALRRVCNFAINHHSGDLPPANGSELLQFLTDFSALPKGSRKVVDIGPIGPVDAVNESLLHRFYEGTA